MATEPADELPKRYELLLAHARAAYEEQQHRYEWGEVKISRYLTVLTVIIGLASVRLPELTGRVGHPRGFWEWSFVVAYSLTVIAAIASLSLALSGLAYARVPSLAMDPDLVAAVTTNPLSDVMGGLAERYFEAARALRSVNAARF